MQWAWRTIYITFWNEMAVINYCGASTATLLHVIFYKKKVGIILSSDTKDRVCQPLYRY